MANVGCVGRCVGGCVVGVSRHVTGGCVGVCRSLVGWRLFPKFGNAIKKRGSMSKTNLDDLDLGRRGIEAQEVNSEAAAAGAVLTADGIGGAAWLAGPAVSAAVVFHETEDDVALGASYDLHQAGAMYLSGPGWSLDGTTGAAKAGPELAGRLCLVIAQVGFATSGKTGYGRLTIQRSANGGGFFGAISEAESAFVDGATATMRCLGWCVLQEDDLIKAEFRPIGAPAGTGALDVGAGWTAVMALDGDVVESW